MKVSVDADTLLAHGSMAATRVVSPGETTVPGRPGEGELGPGDPRLGRYERVIAALFVCALATSALVGSVFVLLPSGFLLLPLPLARARALHRAIANAVAGAWFTFASALIEKLARVRLSVSGDSGPRPAGERVAILICNHNCRLDWLFLWPLACRMLCAGRLKIALKDDMKKLPLFGWAMQAFLFIFLSRRNKPLDLERIGTVLSYLVEERAEPILLLVFPEGTDLSPASLARDAAFIARATAAGAPAERPYRHVLHPRTAGFTHAVKTLGNRLDAVYDATISYERHPDEARVGARPSEKTLLRGTFPRTVSVHVERFGKTSLPPLDDEEAVGAWLNGRWAAKEAMLERLLVEGTPPPSECPPRASLGAEYRLALVGWGSTCALLLVGLCTWRPLLLYTVAGTFGFWLLTTFAGGLDDIELARSACVAPAGRHDNASDGGARRSTHSAQERSVLATRTGKAHQL